MCGAGRDAARRPPRLRGTPAWARAAAARRRRPAPPARRPPPAAAAPPAPPPAAPPAATRPAALSCRRAGGPGGLATIPSEGAGLGDGSGGFNGLVVDRALHQHPRRRVAGLARVVEAMTHAARDGLFICIGEDDVGPLAPQFQADAFHPLCL